MLLGGLWHGAAWNFIVWGAWQGFWLVIERLIGKRAFYSGMPRPVQIALTFVLALIGWVFFRAGTLGDATAMLGRMLPLSALGLAAPLPHAGLWNPAAQPIPHQGLWWLGVAGFALVHWMMGRQLLVNRLRELPDWAYALAYGASVALLLPWVATDYQPFIYFQF
jgi:alginate O-acetyltransferase complex protein AlgI